MRKTYFLGREVPLHIAVGALALFPFVGLLVGITVGLLLNRSENGLPDSAPKVEQLDSNFLTAGEEVVVLSNSPKQYSPGNKDYKPNKPVLDSEDFKEDELDSEDFKEDSNFLTAGEEVVDSYSPGGFDYSSKPDRRSWYNKDVINWARNHSDIRNRICSNCKNRFSDSEITIIKEKVVSTSNKTDKIEFEIEIRCGCSTHKSFVSGNRLNPDVEYEQWKEKTRKRSNSQAPSRLSPSYQRSRQ